jgi:hypothetical protein
VRWYLAASGGDWKMAWGARLSPVKGVGPGRASTSSYARKNGEGVKRVLRPR